MATGGRVLWHDERMAMGQLGRVTASVVRAPLTLPALQQMRRFAAERQQEFGSRRASLVVIESTGVSDVPKEVREGASQLIKEFPTDVTATVIEGGGFKAIAGRAIMTGLRLLGSGRGGDHKIFAEAAEAAAWLSTRVPGGEDRGGGIDATAIVRLIDLVREAIRA